MSNRRVPLEKRKYLLKDSDRSGFTYFKQELVKDDGWWVHPDEKDDPPPTKHYIGGEGEVNRDGVRANRTANPHPGTAAEEWEP